MALCPNCKEQRVSREGELCAWCDLGHGPSPLSCPSQSSLLERTMQEWKKERERKEREKNRPPRKRPPSFHFQHIRR